MQTHNNFIDQHVAHSTPEPHYSWYLVATDQHIHMFNSPFSRTNRVSRYQQGKSIWILPTQEKVSGNGISWAICKSAPRSRQITMPAPNTQVFYRHALPAAQPTASKHWRQTATLQQGHNFSSDCTFVEVVITSDSSPRHSGIAGANKKSQSFTYQPHVYPQLE